MTASLGIVKWFGGYNSKTESENKYGFIEDSAGVDIFLHLNEWTEDNHPREGQMLTYSIEESKGKYSAKSAKALNAADYSLDKLAQKHRVVFCCDPEQSVVDEPSS